MKLRTTSTGLIAHDEATGRWFPIPGEDDLLAFLAKGEDGRERARAALDAGEEVDPATAGLPFRPRSIRA